MGALFEKLKIELIFFDHLGTALREIYHHPNRLHRSKNNTTTTTTPLPSLRRPRRGPERLDEAYEDSAFGEEVHLVAVAHGRGTKKRGGAEKGPLVGGAMQRTPGQRWITRPTGEPNPANSRWGGAAPC